MVLQVGLIFALLSVVAVGGGNAVLPEMHRQLVDLRGWMDDATFTQLFALAQAAPGPNVLVASVMGWHVAGPAGMAAATAGMLLPAAVLAWTAAGVLARLRHAAWLKPAQAGLVPIALGLLLSAGVTMAGAAQDDGWLVPAIIGASALLVWRTGRSPLWALAGGAMLGLLLP